MVFLSRVLPLPVLVDGVGCLDEPGAVLEQFENINRREKFRSVLGRIAQRLEQPGRNQRRNVMRLAVQHPARLLRREPGRQLPHQRQKPMLVFFHTQPVAGLSVYRTGIPQLPVEATAQTR